MITAWLLPEGLDAPAFARRVVSGVLESLGASAPQVDDAALIASELAANAVIHGHAPAHLRVQVAPDRFTISVSNSAPTGVPRPPLGIPSGTVSGDHGRGLAIVGSLAQELTWRHDGGLLEVRAVLHRTPGAAP